MNNKNDVRDISYFTLSLVDFLRESHPERLSDNEFIDSRSEAAAEAYEQAVRNGYGYIDAVEYANEVLFRNLHFSKYNTLVNILWNEFADVIEPDKAKTFAINILPECEAVFVNYPLSADFEYEPEWDLLYTELTGTISIYLEEHGLQ